MCPNPWEGEQLVLRVQKDEGHTEWIRMAHDMSLILGQPLTGLKTPIKPSASFPPAPPQMAVVKMNSTVKEMFLIIYYRERYSQKKHKKIREENV